MPVSTWMSAASASPRSVQNRRQSSMLPRLLSTGRQPMGREICGGSRQQTVEHVDFGVWEDGPQP